MLGLFYFTLFDLLAKTKPPLVRVRVGNIYWGYLFTPSLQPLAGVLPLRRGRAKID
jgi:hypothetical protein